METGRQNNPGRKWVGKAGRQWKQDTGRLKLQPGSGLLRQEDSGNRKAEQPREEVDRKEEPAEMPVKFQRK